MGSRGKATPSCPPIGLKFGDLFLLAARRGCTKRTICSIICEGTDTHHVVGANKTVEQNSEQDSGDPLVGWRGGGGGPGETDRELCARYLLPLRSGA